MDVVARLGELLDLTRSPVPAGVAVAWGALGLAVAPFLWWKRTRMRFVLRIGACFAALTAVFLVFTERAEARHLEVVDVEGFWSRIDALRGKRLLVYGELVEGSLSTRPGTPARHRLALRGYASEVVGPRSDLGTLTFEYEGALPASLTTGNAIATVEGHLTARDHFETVPGSLEARRPCSPAGAL